MMETIVTNGLVIRQLNYGDADRILTIFTQDIGIVQAIAKSARKYKSHQGGAAQFLCYSQFTLRKGKNADNMYTLQGTTLLKSFYAVGSDIQKLALATYLCDITGTFVMTDTLEPEMLRLLLNTLYILAKKDRPLMLIKAVYELRLSSAAGFEPEMSECVRCQKTDDLHFFSCLGGGLVCSTCAAFTVGSNAITSTVCHAIRYILQHPIEKIFAFDIAEQSLVQLSRLAESFLITHADKSFFSLDYYNKLL